MNRALWLLALCAFPACGMKRVSSSIIERLPYESRIDLLEAENDLAIAVDRLDEARHEVTRSDDQIRRAKERLSGAKDESGNASDDASRKVAELAIEESRARIEWLRALKESREHNVDVQKVALQCAVARFEKTKVEVVRQKKVEGSESVDPAAFEAQLKRCEERQSSMVEAGKKVTAVAEERKEAWEKAKTALAQKTFDARASPYVE